MNDRVIEMGTEVEFLNGIDGRLHGIVNGQPMVGWNETSGVLTYLPVFVASLNETMYVNGANITGLYLAVKA